VLKTGDQVYEEYVNEQAEKKVQEANEDVQQGEDDDEGNNSDDLEL